MHGADTTPPAMERAGGRAADEAWAHNPDGLAIVDVAGGILASNPAFDRIVGRDGLIVAGLDLGDVLAPDDAAIVLSADETSERVPVAGRRPDGRPFCAEMQATPLDDDRLLVTARRRGHDVADDASESSGACDDLAGVLSHDVRGRLRNVAGFLGICVGGSDQPLPDESLQYLERAAAAGRAADLMLDRLVRYLRLERTVYRLTPTSLDELLADAVSLAGNGVAVQSDPLPVVFADGPLLAEALAELIRNAGEFARDDVPPIVAVSARQRRGWCELSITDNGRGIAPDLRDDAFGLCRQLQPRDWERGVGMGLPICRRIVDGHGGVVTIDSDGSTGTTVSVRLALPASAAPAANG